MLTPEDDDLGALIESQRLVAEFRRLAAEPLTDCRTAMGLSEFADEIEADARRLDRDQTRARLRHNNSSLRE